MSSTNPTPADALLAALFDDIMLPMSQRMRAAGQEAFPEAPDVQWLSYYVRRKHVANVPADFHDGACSDVAEFEAKLTAQWMALGRDELAGHAGRFAEAAAVLRSELAAGGDSGSAEVSPYVYVMF